MSEKSKVLVATSVLPVLLLLSMRFGLGFVFDEHVAGLLAGITTWSLLVLASAWNHVRLFYRHGFFAGSGVSMFMTAFHVAPLIVGAKPFAFTLLVILILTLPGIAISVLLERILFTAEERLEIKSRYSQRTQVS